MRKYSFDGENFKRVLRRATNNATQENIQEKTGIPHNQLSDAYQGKKPPSSEYLAQLALEYNVSVDELLGIKEIREKQPVAPSPRIFMSMVHSLCELGVLDVFYEEGKMGHFNTWIDEFWGIKAVNKEWDEYIQAYFELRNKISDKVSNVCIQAMIKSLPTIQTDDQDKT